MMAAIQKPKISLSLKFSIIFTFTAILASLFMVFAILQTSYRPLEKEAFGRMETIANLRLTQIHSFIERLENDAVSFLESDQNFYADLTAFHKGDRMIAKEHIRDHLDQFISFKPAVTEIFIMDPQEGSIVISTDLSNEGQVKKGFSYFEEGKIKTFHTPVYTSPVDRDPTLVFVYPLKNVQNELLYVVGLRLNLASFEDILSFHEGLGKTGLTYLVDAEHRVIAGLDVQYDFQKKLHSLGIDEALSGKTGVQIYTDEAGNEVLGYYKWIPDLELAFIAEQQVDEAFVSFRSLRQIVIAFVMTILFFVLLVAGLLVRAVTNPIRILTAFAQDVAQGKLKGRAQVHSQDELGILAGSLNDMTDHLTASFEESKTIIDVMPDALFTLDSDGKIKFLNRSALALCYFSKAKVTGRVFAEFLLCHDQRGHFIDRLRKEGQLSDIQCRFMHNHHQRIPVSVSGTVLRDPKGSVRGFLVIVKDLRELQRYAKARIDLLTPFLQRISLGDFSAVTPLLDKEDEFRELFLAIGLMTDNLRQLIKENEDKTKQILETHQSLVEAKTNLEAEKVRLNSILENMGDGLIAVDTEDRLLLMNKAAEQFFEKDRNTLLGKNFLKEVSMEDKEGHEILGQHHPVVQAMEHRRHVLKTVFILKRPYRILASPLMLNRKLFGAVAILQDISREQAIDKAKSEFVSLASHQLRTPLTSIRWLLEEVLRKKGHPDKGREEYLENALQSTQRMIRLVNDLLNLSRMEAGAIDVEPQETNLADLVAQVVSDARVPIAQHRQTVLIHKPKGGIPLRADPVLIRQVVTNLLSNALRYSDPDKTITITLEKKGGKAWFIIQDQGIGIPKDQQHRVYEKFFRTEEASKRSTSGSGLGMYLVKKIMDAIHGVISFTSAPGKGTTFRVGIPLRSATAHKGPQKLIEYHIS
jgi:PAS domain S-box-containing protein